jgi:hypothetical protein
MVVHICNPCYTGGIDRRIAVPGQSRQNCKNLSKNIFARKGEGARCMAQAVECLPSKCKALSSNSSTANQERNKQNIWKDA